jgi:hypothetical protein
MAWDRGFGDVSDTSRLRGFGAVSILLVLAFSLAACGGSSDSSGSSSLLPRKVVVPINQVQQFFPQVTIQASTGRNSTATGNPKATRSVIYTGDDGSQKVTITVDQYGTLSSASSAYQEAVEKSEAVEGFTPISVTPPVGQESFAGTVTQGGETHIGLGALDGKLVVGVTLAGFSFTDENVTNLISLARVEDAVATALLGGGIASASSADMPPT